MKNAFSWRRALAITKKELFHIMRDPFTLLTALGLPVFMVVLFGVAIEFNVKNIPLAVSDSDQSYSSRALCRHRSGARKYFHAARSELSFNCGFRRHRRKNTRGSYYSTEI